MARRQLRALGLTDTAIEHGAVSGRLFPLFHTTFAVGHSRVGSRGRMLAAVLACGEGAVVSHGTAAVLLGLWDHEPDLVDVIAPGQSGRKITGIRRHHVSLPIPAETGVCESIPCTSPSRTLVDIAGMGKERTLRRTVEKAAVLRVLDVPAVDAVLARGRRRGGPLMQAVLEDWRRQVTPIRLRSPLEARLMALIAAHGLPAPLCNQELRPARRRMEVDFLWPEQRLVVETDGWAFHGHVVAANRDYRRDRELAQAGYRVLRVTWAHLEQEPDETVAALRRLFGSLRRRGK